MLVRTCFHQNRVLADAFDIAPRDDYAVFGREGSEQSAAGEHECGYLARASIDFEIANATQKASVTDVNNFFVSQFRKGG